MADKSQRTEKPTAKHRKEMREEGTVARSTSLSGWASLLVAVSLLPWLGGWRPIASAHSPRTPPRRWPTREWGPP